MIRCEKLLWDQTFPIVRLTGDGTITFLHGQTSADIVGAKRSALIHSCWLNTLGGVRAFLEIRLTDNAAEIIVLGGDISELMRSLEKAIFPMDKVRLQLSGKIRRVQNLSSNQLDRFNNIAWLLPGEPLPKDWDGFQIPTTNQFERWRMQHSLLTGPEELNGKNNPFELGFGDMVSLNKGCYLGQEIIAKLMKAGKVRQQIRFIESECDLFPGQNLLKGVPDLGEKKIVGKIISFINDKENQINFGLAMVKNSACLEQELLLEDDLNKSVFIKAPLGFVGFPDGR